MNDEPLKPIQLRIRKKRYVGPCIYKVKQVRSPIQEIERGHRILVAVPNLDGVRPYSNLPCAMFSPRYLIMLSSDYCDYEIAQVELQVVCYLREVKGFDRVEIVDEFEERMYARLGIKREEEAA